MTYTMQEYNAFFVDEAVRQVAKGIAELTPDEMHFRLHKTSNSIAWDAWHIFRTVDNIVHYVFEKDQPVWLQQGLDEKWNLPRVGQGTGMPPEEAWALRFPAGADLAQYGDDVVTAVVPRILAMSDDYTQIITMIRPWGEVSRLWALGKLCTHSSKHLGYIAGALGVLGRQGPSF